MAAWLGGGERGKGPRDLAALPILCPGQQRRLRRLLDLPHSAGTATRPQQPLLEQRTSNVDTHSHGDAPKTITLDRSGKHTKPRVHETTGVKLTGYPGTVRQLIVTGLGHDAPTVIITNDHTTPTKALLARYARRMTIEQRLAEIIRAFHLDALSSTVNLNVDLDVVLCVLAQAVTAAFRTRLGGGYTTVTPDVLQRRFLQTAGEITHTDDTTTVRIDRRAY